MGILGSILAALICLLVSFFGSLIVGMSSVAIWAGRVAAIIIVASALITFIQGMINGDKK